MEFNEAKEQFINSWGSLGSSWGVSRTMAQVHALLLITQEPISAEDVMEKLNISRGNANMSLRALIDWGLIDKKVKLGERREYFLAEKDLWKVAMRIAKERRKRELEPIMSALAQVKEINPESGDKKEIVQFKGQMEEIEDFAGRVDGLLNKLATADENWFTSLLARVLIK
ncbi:MAG: transcriptional regulator [Cryomorphaceae bacterium]|nr:transcriptional regulator [Cryomorphaceae bacterium]